MFTLQELHVLETYEDSSEGPGDFDVFSNLTFRFSCEGKPIGLYADLDYDCRIFHVCDDSGKGFPVICPNNTLFDQEGRVCNDEEHVDCEHTNEWCSKFFCSVLQLPRRFFTVH